MSSASMLLDAQTEIVMNDTEDEDDYVEHGLLCEEDSERVDSFSMAEEESKEDPTDVEWRVICEDVLRMAQSMLRDTTEQQWGNRTPSQIIGAMRQLHKRAGEAIHTLELASRISEGDPSFALKRRRVDEGGTDVF